MGCICQDINCGFHVLVSCFIGMGMDDESSKVATNCIVRLKGCFGLLGLLI